MSAKIPYISGNFHTAVAAGPTLFSAPFPGISSAYLLRQRFMQDIEFWGALPLNTPHPAFTQYYLVEESPLDDSGVAGIVSWNRTYARVPDSYNEPGGNYAYNFIGFFGVFGINVTTITGRDRFTRNVPVKVVKDFFLVDADTGTPGGDIYDDWTNIPTIPALRYYYASNPELDVDALADSPPFSVATTPSRTQYQDLIDADAFNVVVEESRLTRWMGNIYMRETMYVKAI